MAFSIKQIKAILSSHNMPVEDLDAAAEDICARHSADLDSIKEERDTFKKNAETLADVQKELDAIKANTGDDFKAKYEKEKKDFDDYKAEVEGRETLSKKKAALEKIAKDAGLSENGVAKAVKYADFGKIQLDDNGEVKDAKDLIKSLKEEWSDYVQTRGQQGARTATPPRQENGGTLKTRDEIYKRDESGRFVLDANQRQEALAQLIAAEQQQKG